MDVILYHTLDYQFYSGLYRKILSGAKIRSSLYLGTTQINDVFSFCRIGFTSFACIVRSILPSYVLTAWNSPDRSIASITVRPTPQHVQNIAISRSKQQSASCRGCLAPKVLRFCKFFKTGLPNSSTFLFWNFHLVINWNVDAWMGTALYSAIHCVSTT